MSMDIVVEIQPKEEELEVILEGLKKYNENKLGKKIDKKKLGVFLKDNGNIVGGIEAFYFKQWMYIQYLWIDDRYRGNDYGTKLMEQVDKKALELGCNVVMVDTFSFQAPEFYLKQGFTQYTQIENNPIEGVTRHYYMKRLR